MKNEYYNLFKDDINFKKNEIIKIFQISEEFYSIEIDMFMLNRIEKLSKVSDKFKDYYKKLNDIIEHIKLKHLPFEEILV